MKARHGIAVIAVLLAGCGGGEGSDSAVSANPPAAPQPAGTPAPQPPAAQPPAAQPPAAQPPSAPPPASPTPSAPPPASPPPASPPPPPPPPPPPSGPSVQGDVLTTFLMTSTASRFGPDEIFQAGKTDRDMLGSVWSYQSNSSGSYTFHTSQYHYGIDPYWNLAHVSLQVQYSEQGGELWLGPTLRATIDTGEVLDLTHPDGGFTINPGQRYLLDTTLTQWTAPGTPYYVQLQSGTYKDTLRHCWHMRLPGGILRRGCHLWTEQDYGAGKYWGHSGYLIDDDSYPRYGNITFATR